MQGPSNELSTSNGYDKRKKSKSKENQANKEIDFLQLKTASPFPAAGIVNQSLLLHDFDELRVFSHDASVSYLNEFINATVFLLPLEQMNLILIKFKTPRYGILSNAEKLYAIICDKYGFLEESDIMALDRIHCTMMEIYTNYIEFPANDRLESLDFAKRIKKIFTDYPSNNTFAALLKAILKLDKKITLSTDEWIEYEIQALFTQYPKLRNDAVYAYYLNYLHYTQGLNVAENKYRLLISQQALRESDAFAFMIDCHEQNVEKAWEYYAKALEVNPENQKDNSLNRSLLKVLVHHESTPFAEAWKFFESIITANLAIYQVMIAACFKAKEYDKAYGLYQKTTAMGFLKESVPVKESSSPLTLKVDLHCRDAMHDGALRTPTAFDNGLIYVVIRRLFSELAASPVGSKATVITGKGSFITRLKIERLCTLYFMKYEIENEYAGHLNITFNPDYDPSKLAEYWCNAIEEKLVMRSMIGGKLNRSDNPNWRKSNQESNQESNHPNWGRSNYKSNNLNWRSSNRNSNSDQRRANGHCKTFLTDVSRVSTKSSKSPSANPIPSCSNVASANTVQVVDITSTESNAKRNPQTDTNNSSSFNSSCFWRANPELTKNPNHPKNPSATASSDTRTQRRRKRAKERRKERARVPQI